MKPTRGEKGSRSQQQAEHTGAPGRQGRLASSLARNLDDLRAILDSYDIVFREFSAGIGSSEVRAAVIYVEGLTETTTLNEQVLKPLMVDARRTPPEGGMTGNRLYEFIKGHVVSVSDVHETDNFDELVLRILSGESAFLIHGQRMAMLLSAKAWEMRGVEEPETESIVRGPRDGFTETLRVNTALLRRRLRDPNLKIRSTQIGRRTKTDVAVAYIQGIVNPTLLDEVKSRLDTLDVDSILESGYIEQLIEDDWASPFPQINSTERPDEVTAGLLSGQVAILTDTSPFVLLAPSTFVSFMSSPEDFYERWHIASFIRLLRYAGVLITLFAPALYIAFTSYNPEMFPGPLLRSAAGAREGVPFPAFVEALIMETAIEVLREAGVRLPGPIGQTIGIVGGLVVGQAAVEAGIVSPLMVIVVAFTAISSFAIPSYSLAIALRMIRFLMMLAAALFELYGVIMAGLILLTHLASLKSFGVNYLAPLAPVRLVDWKDAYIRGPWPLFKRRPTYTHPVDVDRMDDERRDNQLVRRAQRRGRW